jgi:sugar phosphate isomerase/epimerase
MKVSCFASAIANWATKISHPFERDRDILARSLPRMKRLGTPFIRIMSYPNDNWPDAAWRDEVIKRLKELSRMAGEAGATLALENCDGWASQSPQTFAEIFEQVDHPALRAVYDTGNPAGHGLANTWEWFQTARPFISYIHIKDHTGPLPGVPGDGEKGHFTWPGEGVGKIPETLRALAESGYAGGFSIEPHIKAVVHAGQTAADPEDAYRMYIEYGKRAQAIADVAFRGR